MGFGWVRGGGLDEFRRGWAKLARDVDNVFCFALTFSSLVKRKKSIIIILVFVFFFFFAQIGI